MNSSRNHGRRQPFQNAIGIAVVWRVGTALWLLSTASVSADQAPYRRDAETLENSGFLFLDGQYLSPPYAIGWDRDTGLTVNEHVLGTEYIGDAQDSQVETSRHADQVDPSNSARRGLTASLSRIRQANRGRYVKEMLNATLLSDARGVAFLNAGQTPIFLNTADGSVDLLRAIASEASGATLDHLLDAMLLSDADRKWLACFVSGLTKTPELCDRLDHVLEVSDRIERTNVESSSSLLLTQKLSYPLTMFAMMMVVFSAGNLLQNRPIVETFGDPELDASRTRSVVSRSLLIFFVLSGIDLVWTLVAARSGSMRELNPLVTGLIANPMQLAAFKFTVVAGTSAILYGLHQRPLAQMVSWWGCLVLTMLTARWLMFNSMFL